MTEALTPTQLDAINRMPAEQRYDYFIGKVVALQQVWGLASVTGWLILPEAGEEQLPVWPHAELAAAWATGGFSDCQPQAIGLDDWLAKWLPGMANDGLLIAACPATECDDSIVVAADELLADIEETIKTSPQK